MNGDKSISDGNWIGFSVGMSGEMARVILGAGPACRLDYVPPAMII